MPSAVIRSDIATRGCPWGTTGTPVVRPTRSSRTRVRSSFSLPSQEDRDRTVSRVLNPARYRLNGNSRTLGTCPGPGCDEPTSRVPKPPRRCGALGGDQPVIPRGTFLSFERLALPIQEPPGST